MKEINNYKKNNNIVYFCRYHVIWCVKYRRPLLTDGVAEDLKAIIEKECKESSSELITMEIMPEHVHLLIGADPQWGINKVIKSIKGTSSRYLRNKYKFLKTKLPTLWTNSYFISTLGNVSEEVVKQYINNQKVSQREKHKDG